MICDNCGNKGAKIRKVSQSYDRGKKLLVIENVPIISCYHCVESCLTAKTLHEIERIKTHRKALTEKHTVEVADFIM